MILGLYSRPGFLLVHPQFWSHSIHPLQAVSVPPPSVPSSGLICSTQPPSTLVDTPLSLGSAGWPTLIICAGFPLFWQPQTSCYAPLDALKLSFCPSNSPCQYGKSHCVRTFPLLYLPPRDASPIPIPFSISFSFLLSYTVIVFLPSLKYEVFCQRSVDIF